MSGGFFGSSESSNTTNPPCDCGRDAKGGPYPRVHASWCAYVQRARQQAERVDVDLRGFDDLFVRVAGELLRAPPMELHLEPLSVLHLVGLVQLALRAPNLPDGNRELANRIVFAASLHFRGFPATLEMIQRGNDPANDVSGS